MKIRNGSNPGNAAHSCVAFSCFQTVPATQETTHAPTNTRTHISTFISYITSLAIARLALRGFLRLRRVGFLRLRRARMCVSVVLTFPGGFKTPISWVLCVRTVPATRETTHEHMETQTHISAIIIVGILGIIGLALLFLASPAGRQLCTPKG